MEIADYIEAHTSAQAPELRELERQANLRLLYPHMLSGNVQGRLLKMLTSMAAPRRVLEVGTYAGYSALCIAEGMARGTELHTVEIDDEKEDFLRRAFASSPHGGKIRLHIGDIFEVLPTLGPEPFDMVYMDANKRTYPEVYELLLPHLRTGGFMIADNTLWGGHVADPSRHDAQTLGIRRFNDLVAADPRVEAVVVPLRDGLTLLRKMA